MDMPALGKAILTYLHPVMMWALLGLTLYALYSGMKSRQIRSATGAEKKALIQGRYRDKHFLLGSLILALMVLGNVGGIAVTYMNNHKLFVGPHLIAGLGMTTLIAIAASLVPLMQKGNRFARNTHIAINIIILGLFGWQAITGMEIVQRIMEQG
ncbi:DUF4079 domain-containing protein [Lyngbya confervoides]|uniref:DUF4079 domain-containing protein n=1 Tax=Lyngbya confervoides BDU141951 TaxID=1574623 RepID=A0ABD4T0H9_9CYAN|nr:DUF4079 domain-containing protein [Lyngbya confervoides]MCM1982024.1 DUF4079 domain-containing protein [Lyngbya confervoides BDU141951]